MPRSIACAYPTADDPDLAGQIAALEAAGADLVLTSRTRNARRGAQTRAQAKLLDCVEPGDTVILLSFHQVAATVIELVRFLKKLDEHGAQVRCLDPDISTGDAAVHAFLVALHDVHTRRTRHSIREGIASRRSAGGEWGRTRRITPDDWPAISAMLKTQRAADVAAHYGVTRQTIYNLKRQMGSSLIEGGRPSKA